jgi:excinuclease ABC subunit A
VSAPSFTAAEAQREIVLTGCREHNLKNVDVRIPRDQLVVITGPSGSGKSSLAFDTIYNEGQRRYVESLSAYARQFLDQMTKPEVESIEGLSPAISIEQKTVSKSPRSTVGTATEISDYLRLLYARVGRPHCFGCGNPISSQSVSQMTERILGLPEGAAVQILAPVVRGRRGSYKKELRGFRSQGFVRVRIDGEMHDLSEELSLERQKAHNIDVVVDRLKAKESARLRVAESVGTALKLADGLLKIQLEDGNEWLLSRDNACHDCGVSFPEISPAMFSFNNPRGACPECSGLGTTASFDLGRVIPDPSLSLTEGAIEPWAAGANSGYFAALLQSLADHLGVGVDLPWSQLPKRAQHTILHGSGNEPVAFVVPARRGRLEQVTLPWGGVVDELERRSASGERAAGQLARYRTSRTCSECHGARIGKEGRSVRLGGEPIDALSRLSIDELARFLDQLVLEDSERLIADRILLEIAERLRFLAEVGLGYLSLDRRSATLSGGEGQRVRLATQIGSSLMGVLYILDEPSIGLHARDHGRLLKSLLRLRDMGNSVLVVEHDEATIRSADHIIDMGPGAGVHGGHVVAQGSPLQLCESQASPTGAFLSGRRCIDVPAVRRKAGSGELVLSGCRENNLKNLTLRIPLALLTVVTGVSGSGKSTLLGDTLQRALAATLYGAEQSPGEFDSLVGIELIDKVIDVSQAPIGRTPRSNPATYTGAFDSIRKLFAGTPEARMRGYGPGRFSFNVKGGRCETCRGDGLLRIEMNFLPDLFIACEICSSRRYNRETLEIRYKGKSIAEVLDMSVEEALVFAENVDAVRRPLQGLADVGLGYLKLGQPATTLSGGEAQRVKLARELTRRGTGRTLYLLDEPTTGLHFEDVERLLELLVRLVDLGNTVVVIEHHLDVIKCADHVIDLGPEGGEAGGEIVVQGSPEEVARHPHSHTGSALQQVIAN